jgi:hypothetical protein
MIKFYLLAGLLPPGEPTGDPRLADYGLATSSGRATHAALAVAAAVIERA